ncbi:MAG: glycosyltransferase [Deltaproteobacteria bacterium]|nr:glycosyltransferase [Deltaproteobacteria bacterium]
MRVLLVTDDLPRVPRGGLDRHVAELALALRQHDVHAVTVKLAEGEAERMARLNALYAENRGAGEQAAATAVTGAKGHPATVVWGDSTDGSGGLRGTISNKPLLDAFGEALDVLEPDVVHIHNLQHLSHRIPEIARKRGLQVVWTMHDFFALCQRGHLHRGDLSPCDGPSGGVACGPCFGGGLRGLLAAPVFGLRHAGFVGAMRQAHAIVAPSQFLADIVVQHGAPEHRVHVLPPAVPRSPRMAELATDPEQVRFVYAGDLRKAKGPDLALAALQVLSEPGVSLDIHGGSPAPPAPPESEFETQLQAMSSAGNVRFHGRYDDADLLGLLDGAAALIVPSRVRETFGRTANRALQAGVPVIAADHGALPEHVQDGVNGALFRPGDADSLADAMRRVIELGIGMQASAEDWPEAPDLAKHVEGLLPLYEWSP